MESPTRNTAYKVWIADLVVGKFIKGQEQFDSGYVEVKNKKISRVNLICGVVDKFSGNNYMSLSLDDGSGAIRVKAWNETINLFLDVDIGDLVLVIGKVREYNNSIYIVPEIVRKLDNPLWLKVRRLELTKFYGEPQRVELKLEEENNVLVEETPEINVIEEKIQDEDKINSREVVLSLIESLDLGDGANFDDVVIKSSLGEEAKNIIEDLIKGGEVFELHKGKLRIIG